MRRSEEAEARLAAVRRRRRWREAVGVALPTALGAIVLAVAGGSVALTVVAMMLLGIAGVLVVALLFYEVGMGEDEDRASGWRGPYDGV